MNYIHVIFVWSSLINHSVQLYARFCADFITAVCKVSVPEKPFHIPQSPTKTASSSS